MENRPSRIIIKIEWKAGMFETVYGNKVIIFLERGRTSIYTGSTWWFKRLRVGRPIFCTTWLLKKSCIFLSDVRYLDNQLKRKLYPMPKINEILFKLEVYSMIRHLI